MTPRPSWQGFLSWERHELEGSAWGLGGWGTKHPWPGSVVPPCFPLSWLDSLTSLSLKTNLLLLACWAQA